MSDGLGPSPHSQAILRLLRRGDVVAEWRRERFEREERRADKLQEAIERRVAMGDLLNAVREDERLEEMFRVAVDAAVSSTSDLKIKLLGGAVASGALVDDTAKVDESVILLRLATELEVLDLRAIVAMSRASREERHELGARPVRFLADTLGIGPAIARPILSRLEQLGLVERVPIGSVSDASQDGREYDTIEVDYDWNLTDTAGELLDLLHDQ
ncbi:hypothetical protein [Nocardioides sp. L-11A]|uniref:hypothetical protein n=1 Tax=Nocardioides sp. L-11A TaxID=3043848 RepID=UPI00249CE282|nr:hypothetical protein QJ852_06465 [Nocardioides sp. L-11A]